ncbi:hypothetical protein WME97_33750 [Sorangium sp. So ce367]|uniref:hypothetical protein n=1 Tax=Sorangium sp. So ce367 TaxID=3133305 RepID=UPI003F6323CF
MEPGHLDPYGTQRAWKISRVWMSADDLMCQGFTPSQERLVMTFWAKAGSGARLAAGIERADGRSFEGGFHTFQLDDEWKQYKLVVNGVQPPNVYIIHLIPGGIPCVQGDVLLFAPQLSDVDADYLPTEDSGGLDDGAGSLFHRDVIFTRLKTAPPASSAAVPLGGSTGLGDPGAAAQLEVGSSELAGTILLTAGSAGAGASGTVSVPFPAPHGVAPIVLASLADGTSPWPSAARVKVSEATTSGFTLAWSSDAPLVATKAYRLSYLVVGR